MGACKAPQENKNVDRSFPREHRRKNELIWIFYFKIMIMAQQSLPLCFQNVLNLNQLHLTTYT